MEVGEKKINKIKPDARIVKKYDADGWHEWDDIAYYCPTCGRSIRSYGSDNACDQCGTFYDWGDKKPRIETKQYIVW